MDNDDGNDDYRRDEDAQHNNKLNNYGSSFEH